MQKSQSRDLAPVWKAQVKSSLNKTYAGVLPAAEHANNATVSSSWIRLSAKCQTCKNISLYPFCCLLFLPHNLQSNSIIQLYSRWVTVRRKDNKKRRLALTSRRKGSLSETLPVATHWNEAFWPALTSTSPSREKWGTLSEEVNTGTTKTHTHTRQNSEWGEAHIWSGVSLSKYIRHTDMSDNLFRAWAMHTIWRASEVLQIICLLHE